MKQKEKRFARLQCLEEAVTAWLPEVNLVKILVSRQELEPVLIGDSHPGTHVLMLLGLLRVFTKESCEGAEASNSHRRSRHPRLRHPRRRRQGRPYSHAGRAGASGARPDQRARTTTRS